MKLSKKQLRPIFESVISTMPYELPIDRIDDKNSPHHGEYVEYKAQLVWAAMCDVLGQARKEGESK